MTMLMIMVVRYLEDRIVEQMFESEVLTSKVWFELVSELVPLQKVEFVISSDWIKE